MNDRIAREIRVPQLGEGLREVRIVRLLAAPGSMVRRGDPFYVVETDKTTVELEAPFDGTLVQWLASPGDVININAVVATGLSSSADLPHATTLERSIPPRTRAYARTRNISAEELNIIPSKTSKIMPSDVDAYITREGGPGVGTTDRRISAGHRALIFRLRRSNTLVIPASITGTVQWGDLLSPLSPRTTPFQRFAYAVGQTARFHPRFRSIMVSDDTIREFAHVNLGIAVARPDDGLVIASLRDADTLSREEFSSVFFRQLRRAVAGECDEVSEETQVLLTHLGQQEVRNAIPTLVAPASSILFLGPPDRNGTAHLTLTFDHRVMNGEGAARFLRDLRLQLHRFSRVDAAIHR